MPNLRPHAVYRGWRHRRAPGGRVRLSGGQSTQKSFAAVGRRSEVYLPIEVRFVAPATSWLNPFRERASVSIAVHTGHTQDHAFFFRDVEPIFRRFDGPCQFFVRLPAAFRGRPQQEAASLPSSRRARISF